jgi:hypothetical protein
MEKLSLGLRPCRLAREFHDDEAFEQCPKGPPGRITDLASAPSRLAAIPESTNATFGVRPTRVLTFLDQAGMRLIRNTSSRRLMYRSAVTTQVALTKAGMVEYPGGRRVPARRDIGTGLFVQPPATPKPYACRIRSSGSSAWPGIPALTGRTVDELARAALTRLENTTPREHSRSGRL